MKDPTFSLSASPQNKGRSSVSFILDGNWSGQMAQRFTGTLAEALPVHGELKAVCFIAGADFQWDSGTMAFLLNCHRYCQSRQIILDIEGLPQETRTLLRLATSVPLSQKQEKQKADYYRHLKAGFEWSKDWLQFLGETGFSCQRLLLRKSHARWSDSINFFYQAGPSALPIVTLLSFLVGMILAYLGTVQLRQFGVEIYVANLVGLGMVREMGALMTAIIMAGRTGASYAAQLGTMQVNEEIDALTTLGIQPIDYLVLPRMLALVLAMPLLTVFSNILGMMGGALVAVSMDITPRMYFSQLSGAFSMGDVMTGVIKSLVFGVLIAFAGCHAGMRCGRSSAAVGQATMTAVVTAIVYLVIADAGLNILYFHLGI